MLLLLDTHILLSLARNEFEGLPVDIRNALQDHRNALFATTASLWEIAIKHRLRRLQSPCSLDKWPAVLSALAISLMEIHPKHALGEAEASVRTKDPFDRIMLAICQVESMRLVTLDGSLRDHPLTWRLASA